MFDGVAADQGVEVSLIVARFRTEDAAQSLSFLLTRTERSRCLDRHGCVGQIDGEIGDFGYVHHANAARLEPLGHL